MTEHNIVAPTSSTVQSSRGPREDSVDLFLDQEEQGEDERGQASSSHRRPARVKDFGSTSLGRGFQNPTSYYSSSVFSAPVHRVVYDSSSQPVDTQTQISRGNPSGSQATRQTGQVQTLQSNSTQVPASQSHQAQGQQGTRTQVTALPPSVQAQSQNTAYMASNAQAPNAQAQAQAQGQQHPAAQVNQPQGHQIQLGNQAQGQNTIPRCRRTHIGALVDFFKSMPLRLKLSTNKDIESKNCTRAQKTMDHILDPVANAVPGSESASFITINDEELESLTFPAVATSYADVMPTYLTEKLARLRVEREKGDKLDKEKRRWDDSSKDAPTDHASILAARKAKRRCMDGDTLVNRQTINPLNFNFPDIMFKTEVDIPIPLCCFTHETLRRIIDEEASLPLKRGFARLGNDKGPQIIDIEKLLTCWNIKDESLDYAQYLQASSQMYYFYAKRDKDGPEGAWATNWKNHFAFFEEQNDARSFFEWWKPTEARLRKEIRTSKVLFDYLRYEREYSLALNNASQDAAFKARESAFEARMETRFGKYPKGLQNNDSSTSSRGAYSRSSNSGGKPFLSGGAKVSAPTMCILCGVRGHTFYDHPSPKFPEKFSDGNPTWAQLKDGKICTPEGKEICIAFNTRGRTFTECGGHGTAVRVHVCSFCGSKGHHALPLTCKKIT